MNGRLFLVHWKATEAEAYARSLRDAGWEVAGIEAEDGARAARAILADPPEAVVIYLTRLPSHGRQTAVYLRSRKATRQTPLVFVDGQGAALETTCAKVPDGVYTTSAQLPGVLARLIHTRGQR